MIDYELTDWAILGSALGNAEASGLDINDLIECWYLTNSIEEFDAAINALGGIRIIQDEI